RLRYLDRSQHTMVSSLIPALVQRLSTPVNHYCGKLFPATALVVTLYYHEELTLREIGEILGLTEGRICQIHTQAVTRLQGALGAKEEKSTPTERRTTSSSNLLRAA
ncbi:MAG: hypothetical protein FJ147_23195, partial [Deltaproteobacteria bacterium]|nr:hypothetical protein [Deltaproteobacteria bacterium]